MSDVLARNHVTVHGDGPSTLVFAHGFGCDQTIWRRVAPEFYASHRVVLFDYVGAGRSDRRAYRTERYRTLAGYADDMGEVCDALAVRDPVLVAHSVSAMIGVLAAVAVPARFERMVLIGASPHYLNEPGYTGGFARADVEKLLELMEQNYLGWADHFADVAAREAGAARELARSFGAADPRVTREFAEAVFYSDLRAELPRVATPSLLIQCTEDDIVPAGVASYLHAALRGSRLATLEAAGHLPHMTHPAEIVRLIREYISVPRAELS